MRPQRAGFSAAPFSAQTSSHSLASCSRTGPRRAAPAHPVARAREDAGLRRLRAQGLPAARAVRDLRAEPPQVHHDRRVRRALARLGRAQREHRHRPLTAPPRTSANRSGSGCARAADLERCSHSRGRGQATSVSRRGSGQQAPLSTAQPLHRGLDSRLRFETIHAARGSRRRAGRMPALHEREGS